jgi:hypothetical protein
MPTAVGFVPLEGNFVLSDGRLSFCRTIGILETNQILDEEKWRESYQSLNNAGERVVRRENRSIIRASLFWKDAW